MTIGSQVKQSLASIKSAQASLSSLAVRTQSHEAKQAFQQSMTIMNEVKKDLEVRVGELEREEVQYKGF